MKKGPFGPDLASSCTDHPQKSYFFVKSWDISGKMINDEIDDVNLLAVNFSELNFKTQI